MPFAQLFVMTSPAREDGLHSLQVVDIKFARCVVVFELLDAIGANLPDEVYSERDEVPGQFAVAANAARMDVENVVPKV
ncbi:hypothetical protein C7M52_02496 [Mixta theicola]|nr:hypothetical protein C7M52_02496 [Mixta theicola]